MPPIRTPTIKPVKTERTHEENQERAYIAASRRSDRSLEARIESARRASEIHKKRTGRALRVTEQDVVNEEMYEEEDDDLPASYRRLHLSHIQTGSLEFNRRLHAYMTSQMGTRNALMEHGNNFVGPYPNAPFFANQFGQPQQPTMMNPQMLHFSNQNFQQMPYQMPPQGFPGMHHRSASLSTPQDLNNYMQNYPAQATAQQVQFDQSRRMSLPPQPQDAMRPPMSRTGTGLSVADGAGGSPQTATGSPNSQQTPATAASTSSTSAAFQTAATSGAMNNIFAPFSTSLPTETQQLLSQPMGMDNPNSYNPYWFTGNQPPFSYAYKPNSGSQSSSPGAKPPTSMDQTLSLNPLDTNVSGHSPASQGYITSATTDGVTSPFSGTYSNYNFGNDNFFPDANKDPAMSRSSSGRNSGNVTPGAADWANFLEPFEDAGTSQS